MPDRKRILFIAHNSFLYGANKSMLSVARYVKEVEGLEPFVLCPAEGGLTDELKRLQIDYVTFRFHNTCVAAGLKGVLGGLFRTGTDIVNFPGLLKKVRKLNPAIIHSNTSVIYHGYLLAKLLQKKHIWHVREFGWEDYNVMHPLGLGFFKRLLHRSDAVICISKAIYTYFGQSTNPKARVIYNGIAAPALEPTVKVVPAVGTLKFLLVGLISKNKGQLEAIKAFEKLLPFDKDIELTIVGDGEQQYVDSIRAYCQERESLKGSVIFTGYQKNTKEFYRACHYLLMYSKAEGFGRVTVEAMQAGTPVIGYKGGGTEEIVENGYSGYLFSDFSSSLKDIQDKLRDQEVYSRLSENAIHSAHEKFSEKTYCANVVSVIKTLT